jgi:hypothetical protein
MLPQSSRRTLIEKLGDGSDELRRRERLGQKNAVGDALRGPLIGICSGDVEDGKLRVDLSGLPGNFPSPSGSEIPTKATGIEFVASRTAVRTDVPVRANTRNLAPSDGAGSARATRKILRHALGVF